MIYKGSIYVVIDESDFADLQIWSPILTKRFNLDRTLTQISRDSFLDSIHDTIFKKFDQPYFKKSNDSQQILSTINTSNPYATWTFLFANLYSVQKIRFVDLTYLTVS
jgi:hypothetical protein